MLTATGAEATVDLIDVEVFRKALANLTEEMAITLKRASGSSIVVDTHDFSTAIFDADGEQLAFSGWVTMHCASSRIGVKAAIDIFGSDRNHEPGDAIIINDPYAGGALHQADVGLVMPLFHESSVVAWCFSNVHVIDIGGAAIGGLATTAHDVWEEALRFPPTKIASRGVLDPQWTRFIENAVRMPDAVINDLRGMIASGHTAQRKVDELMDRWGPERFRQLSDAAKDLSEEALREKIRLLPDGVYACQEWVEYDGHGKEELPNLRCRLTVEGDRMRVTLDGDPQIDAPVVGTPAAVIGCLMGALLCMLTFDIPMNEGIWRHIEFDLGPPGTIVNPLPPAPVSLSHVGGGFRAGRAFNDIISQICSLSEAPELRARVAGSPQNAVPCSIFFGSNQFGRPTVSVVLSTAIGVGGGAQSRVDGLDCYGAQTMQGTRMPDVEVFEAQEPMLVLYRRLVTDSGGPGALRGGMGMTEATVLWSIQEMRGIAQSHCERIPPRGFAGGFPGATGRVAVLRQSDVRRELAAGRFPELDLAAAETLPSICGTVIERDDVVLSFAGGGGGLGDPLRREAWAVAADVRDGRVSPAAARDVYGVCLRPHGDVDQQGTDDARAAIRAARLGHTTAEPLAPVELGRTPTVAVTLDHARHEWTCATCGHDLGPASANWRSAAIMTERPVASALPAAGQLVRPRSEGPAVVQRELACPRCGSMLSVDVAMMGDAPDPSRQPVSPQHVGGQQ
jgi:N-methylhydantoinase B